MASNVTPPQAVFAPFNMFNKIYLAFCVASSFLLPLFLRFQFKHQSLCILNGHCFLLFSPSERLRYVHSPTQFIVDYQSKPTISLFSPISGTIRAASEALLCGHENMVNNIIASLSCALMLTEKARGARREAGGGACACRGRASDLQKSRQALFLLHLRTQP